MANQGEQHLVLSRGIAVLNPQQGKVRVEFDIDQLTQAHADVQINMNTNQGAQCQSDGVMQRVAPSAGSPHVAALAVPKPTSLVQYVKDHGSPRVQAWSDSILQERICTRIGQIQRDQGLGVLQSDGKLAYGVKKGRWSQEADASLKKWLLDGVRNAALSQSLALMNGSVDEPAEDARPSVAEEADDPPADDRAVEQDGSENGDASAAAKSAEDGMDDDSDSEAEETDGSEKGDASAAAKSAGDGTDDDSDDSDADISGDVNEKEAEKATQMEQRVIEHPVYTELNGAFGELEATSREQQVLIDDQAARIQDLVRDCQQHEVADGDRGPQEEAGRDQR